MKFRDIFAKPVDRPIEGVIKADDQRSLRNEADEYILTNEIEQRLDSFFEAYNSGQNANGVWISGFFGSGKSHLLKMLALLLENRELDGKPTLDIFLDKSGDALLQGAMRKAATIPSRSILFNIDQKAQIISKTDVDALLSVFVSVFDEMCGYSGQDGYVAQFERELDEQGLYGKFREIYKAVAGLEWEKGRERIILQKRNIDKAWATLTGEAENSGIIDKYRSDYKVSIERFATNVKKWLDRQPPDFRLNFFVDEVGQYIAGSIKLMTNLQTIAESLATICAGRAWLIVTAQEELENITGDMSSRQANDFSKIQARFQTRMSLTSQNVDEVIQKRLLLKNQAGEDFLAALYQKEKPNLKTLFSFETPTRAYPMFRDREHFIRSWPFVPYQFQLFQEAIRGLSKHNAFEGRHSSVGERSMLGVFQQVAIGLGDAPPDRLAPFDQMFEGLRAALKSQTQKDILQAQNSQLGEFSLRVLKALYLVKYVGKSFRPTIRNICVLLLESLDQDLPRLQADVEQALTDLEAQTYIQRNGEEYFYLTDEEKDIEQEIKNTDVAMDDIMEELKERIFDQIIGSPKIRHLNGQDYPYARRLDDQPYGQDQELRINVVTPYNDYAGNLATLQMQHTDYPELTIILPPDNRLMQDLRLYRQTQTYIRQNKGQNPSQTHIIEQKGIQNQERGSAIQTRLAESLASCDLLLKGAPLSLERNDAKARLIAAFQELVGRVHTSLGMLGGVNYSLKDLSACLNRGAQGDLGAGLSEAEKEVLDFIQAKGRMGERASVKTLCERFEKHPYGWSRAAVICVIASLAGAAKVEIRQNNELLSKKELEKALANSGLYASLVATAQMEFSAGQISGLKNVFEELFGNVAPGEAMPLIDGTRKQLAELGDELDGYIARKSEFPFLEALRPMAEKIRSASGQSSVWYMSEFVKQADDLLQMRDDLLDPVRAFFKGRQLEIYRRAKAFLASHAADFDYLDGNEASEIAAILDSASCLRGNALQRAAALLANLQKKAADRLAAELAAARQEIDQRKKQLAQMPEFTALTAGEQTALLSEFDAAEQELTRQELIGVLADKSRRFREDGFTRIVEKLETLARPAGDSGVSETSADFKKIVPLAKISSAYPGPFLASAEDVDDWLAAMRESLLAEIEKGSKVQL